jgi:hypothetical protein
MLQCEVHATRNPNDVAAGIGTVGVIFLSDGMANVGASVSVLLPLGLVDDAIELHSSHNRACAADGDDVNAKNRGRWAFARPPPGPEGGWKR